MEKLIIKEIEKLLSEYAYKHGIIVKSVHANWTTLPAYEKYIYTLEGIEVSLEHKTYDDLEKGVRHEV